MVSDVRVECSFLIPIRRDALLSDGRRHSTKTWRWLDEELYLRFGGRTVAPGLYRGFYADPHTGQQVADESRKFIVALSQAQLGVLHDLLNEVCTRFQQKCIYLSVAGQVEFVEARDETV